MFYLLIITGNLLAAAAIGFPLAGFNLLVAGFAAGLWLAEHARRDPRGETQ